MPEAKSANPTRIMAETGASEVYTWAGSIPESTYEPVRGATSDGYNTTTCDLNYVRIDARSTIKQVGVAIAASAEGQKGALGNNNVVIIAIIGIVLLWYVRKNK